MAEPDRDDLADVMVPTEVVHPDRREHAKTPKHPDDDELASRTEHEREVAGVDHTSENA